MPALIDIARVTFGRGDHCHRETAREIFAVHIKAERTTAPRVVGLGSLADAEEQIERAGRAPYDRLMRQPPRPR